MSKTTSKTYLVIVMGLLLSQVFFSCGKGTKPVDPSTIPIPVSTDTVRKGTAVYFANYPGTVTALNQTELRTNVSGYITAISFKEGQVVHSGQKLYEVDRSKYQAAYDQAVANKSIAIANFDRAKQDADRYTNLLKQDAVARQQVDHALTDLQNAKLQVVFSEQAIKTALTDLRYSTITAPFGGTIGISQVKLGALVQAGQTLLNTISSTDPIGVDFVVDEKSLNSFKDYEKAPFNATDSLFTLILPDRSLYKGSGQLTIIDRAIDPQTGTVTARIVFHNQQQDLRAGMSCVVRVRSGQGKQFMLIPAQAVTELMGESFVFVVKENKVHQQKIDAGAPIGSNIIVNSGLNQGDIIVTEGTARLHEGSLINTGAKKEEGSGMASAGSSK